MRVEELEPGEGFEVGVEGVRRGRIGVVEGEVFQEGEVGLIV